MTCRKWPLLIAFFLIVWGFRFCKLTKARTLSERFEGQSPVFAQLRGEIVLPCLIEISLPLEELKVEWKRTESNAIVHLYQGESRPESQNNVYMNRAFFFAEEAAKGNYSLLLRNVTTDDAGNYTCSVYTKGKKTLELVVTVKEVEYLVVTGGVWAVTAYVGGEVTLTCSVESHNQAEEVSWKKVHADKSLVPVLLFQDNEIHPDSGDASYHGRVEFFTSEIPKGNFSLRLKDVRTEDKGEYICEAYSGHLSANTTVILQGLGLSSQHIAVLVLCFSAVILTVGISAVVHLQKTDVNRTLMHSIVVTVPSVIMFFAFVLWGVIEGHQGEVATCSTLNLIRFMLVFKMSQYHENLPGIIKDFFTKNGYFLEYIAITTVLTWVIFYNIWSTEGQSKALAFMGIMSGLSLHMGIKLFFGGKGFLEIMDFLFLLTVSFGSRTLKEDVFKNMYSWVMGISISFWFILFIERIMKTFQKQAEMWHYLVFVFIMRLIVSAITFYYFVQILENNEERAGFLWTASLLHLLALCGIYDCLTNPTLAEKPKAIVYMFGAYGLSTVNAIALASELILKISKGERTVADLRVVLVPFEFVFVLGWIVLWACAYGAKILEEPATTVDLNANGTNGSDAHVLTNTNKDSDGSTAQEGHRLLNSDKERQDETSFTQSLNRSPLQSSAQRCRTKRSVSEAT